MTDLDAFAYQHPMLTIFFCIAVADLTDRVGQAIIRRRRR